ncbi:MAG TPA: AAA family ATPase [Anaerolineales bacterium]|nr:AAA family ATPase [Anaerolineales bacterium]
MAITANLSTLFHRAHGYNFFHMPLRLHLFGTLRAFADEAPLKFPPRSKVGALLAYLVLQREHPLPRALVAGVFWPDESEEAARANLRRHLHLLRNLLPPAPSPWIQQIGETLQWNPQADSWLDVAEFERYSRSEEHWEEAVALYSGDLLENLYEDWVFPERERLRSVYLDILTRLAWKFQSQRDYPKAIRYGAQLLAADPLREDSVRLLMTLRYQAGDRAGALREYEQCRERLRRELGVEPMPETMALYEVIARNAPLPGEAVPAREEGEVRSRPHPGRGQLPFVGRAAEMDEVSAAWSRAASGRGGLLLISGEAGIGKSRLAAELAMLAERQGGRVLYGSVTFGEPRPYQPFQEALQNALPLVASLPISPLSLSAIAHLLPELRLRRAGLPALTPLDPQRERTRFFDALAECLEALARPRPLLLTLEDLHWAGAATIALLEFLARRFAYRPVLIAGTYREEETPRAHPLREVRRRLQQEGWSAHIALGRLTLPAIETLMTQIAGPHTDTGALSHRLYAESEGNPLFLSERLRDLFESGQVQAGEGGWQIHLSEAGGAPRRVEETILERLSRLSPQTRTLAETAATLGLTFDVELLRETGGWSEAETLDGLKELLDRQLVREASLRSRGDYCFSHHLIQETIYAATAPDDRLRRHRRAAVLMEELYASQADEVAGEVARHFEQGGEAERAAAWYLRAAQHAARLYADEEALAHLERGLALTTTPRLRFDLLALQESILHRRGDRPAQKACLEQLTALAHSLGEPQRVCETLWRRILFERALGEREAEAALIAELKQHVAATEGEIWQARAAQAEATHLTLLGRYEAAIPLARRSLNDYQAASDVQGQVECLCLLAGIAVQQGQFGEAQRYATEMQSLAQGNQSLAVQALRAAVAATFAQQDLTASLSLTEQMLNLCRSIHDREGEADAHTHLGVILARLSRLHEAQQHYAEAEKVYRAIGKRQGQAAVLINAGLLALTHLGRYAEARAALEQADALFRTLDDLRGQAIAALNLGMAAAYQGDYPAAKAAAQRALELARAMQSAPLEANALGNLGAAERELGELTQAIEHMEAGLVIRRALGQPSELSADLCDLALAYLRAERLDEARRIRDEMLQLHASAAEVIVHPQRLLWVAAQICKALEETQRARELLTQAYRLLQERANAIPDAALRAAFLALPFNRQISAAYESL